MSNASTFKPQFFAVVVGQAMCERTSSYLLPSTEKRLESFMISASPTLVQFRFPSRLGRPWTEVRVEWLEKGRTSGHM
jgi:hypothetical protein